MSHSSYLGGSPLFIITWLTLGSVGLLHLDYQLCNTPLNHVLILLIKLLTLSRFSGDNHGQMIFVARTCWRPRRTVHHMRICDQMVCLVRVCKVSHRPNLELLSNILASQALFQPWPKRGSLWCVITIINYSPDGYVSLLPRRRLSSTIDLFWSNDGEMLLVGPHPRPNSYK